MLERTNATTNDAKTNECYNERMLQRTVFINPIKTLKPTEMLQQTLTNIIDYEKFDYSFHKGNIVYAFQIYIIN